MEVAPLAVPEAPDGGSIGLVAEVDNRGILLVVMRDRTAARRSKPLAPQADRGFWRAALPEAFAATADDIAAAVADGSMAREGHGIRVAPTQAAVFDEAVARHLRLPELCPHPFVLRCSRRKDGGRSFSVGVNAAEPPFQSGTIDGILIRFRPRTVYRAGARMAELLDALEAVNAAAPSSQRRSFLRLDDYLDRGLLDLLWSGRPINVFQASAMGIDAVPSDDLRLDPVLFSGMPRGPEDEEPPPLLSDDLQSGFVTAFDAGAGGRRSYRISEDAAVVVDAAVERCLRVVKSLRRKEASDRLEFLQDPAPRLAKALGRAGHEAPLIAHGRYAPHVRGIGIWRAPSFPYLSRIETDWIPEQFVVVLGGSEPVTLDHDQVDAFHDAIESAKAGEETTVPLLGRVLTFAAAMDVWRQIERQIVFTNAEDDDEEKAERPPRLSLIVNDNFDAVSHRAGLRVRSAAESAGPLWKNLATKLKNHQTGGIQWLHDRWTSGAPSALLADDMGIGKTLQILVFVDWLVRAAVMPSADASGRYETPILVVAPSTLVDVWRRQLGEHLTDSPIGDLYEPSGQALRAGSSADIARRVVEFHRRPVTVTTYEMMNEHLLVFGAVQWAAVVFDEVQRIKDPATQLRHAATGLNADFVVAASGTPIENRIEDLWSIVDAISPGRLGDLRTFSRTYSNLEIARLRELSVDLLGPDRTVAPDAPPLMMRRFKEDVLDALPAKLVVRHEREMPKEQALAYASAIRDAKIGAAAGVREAALSMVNDVRRISLHPDGAKAVDPRSARSTTEWIARSARLSLTFDILDMIRGNGEKVLIYLDDLEVQYVLAQAIAHRFGTPVPQVINGRVDKRTRTEMVAEFQNGPDGFMPIILSTRVGGVGLHITAANHVVHASRWWNPALEDQCNDRAYRMGQKRDVSIHLPMSIYPDNELPSFDRLVDGLMTDKRLLAREVLVPPTTGRESRELARRLAPMAALAT